MNLIKQDSRNKKKTTIIQLALLRKIDHPCESRNYFFFTFYNFV